MRVLATATATAHSNAVGTLELECTQAGLILGFLGVGAYSEGYIPGALLQGTRLVVDWSQIRQVLVQEDALYLEIESSTVPHQRLNLQRFRFGAGVPWQEQRRRRLLLHFTALSVAVAATAVAALLGSRGPSGFLAWGALGYGVLAALIVLLLGYAWDQHLFLHPPDEEKTRAAFIEELKLYYPALEVIKSSQEEVEEPAFSWPIWHKLLPRTTALMGVTLAATVLTALLTSKRFLHTEAEDSWTSARRAPAAAPPLPLTEPIASTASAPPPEQPVERETGQAAEPSAPVAPHELRFERRCMCDRADSPLWQNPIPRLTSLLLERRLIPTKTNPRTRLEVAVINNGDSPLDELTLHVQFYETNQKKRVPTAERPLYFEGPLRPGQAIKWSTEARGTEFEITTPDLGPLGVNGEGAAAADAFYDLLEARHRPVRLHAARMLGYLGDPRAREAALSLKDALRSAEAPYLRRVLAALHDVRTCDVQVEKKGDALSLGVCVYNASDSSQDQLGVQVQLLSSSLDVSQPLAHPPELQAEQKWPLGEKLDPQAGHYWRIQLPPAFNTSAKPVLEVLADRYDLLD